MDSQTSSNTMELKDDIVTVNVGGQKFTTRKSILEKLEYFRVAQKFTLDADDMIDRDPAIFALLLNMCRDANYATQENLKRIVPDLVFFGAPFEIKEEVKQRGTVPMAQFLALKLGHGIQVQWTSDQGLQRDRIVRVAPDRFMFLWPGAFQHTVFRAVDSEGFLTVEDEPDMVLCLRLPKTRKNHVVLPHRDFGKPDSNHIRAAILYFQHQEEFDRVKVAVQDAEARGEHMPYIETPLNEKIATFYRLLDFRSGTGFGKVNVDLRGRKIKYDNTAIDPSTLDIDP